MAIQGVAIVALTVGIVSLLYYIFANNGAQEEAYGYENSGRSYGASFDRSPNNFIDQPLNREQQNQRQRKRSKRLQNENCTICLQDISDQCKMLPCNHSFHEKCIKTWRSEGPMVSRNTCPICRTSYETI